MAATGNGPQRSCGCWVLCDFCKGRVESIVQKNRDELIPKIEGGKDADDTRRGR